jgi:microcystin-dependent protein
MSEVFIGTIQPFGFNFAPRNWAFCSGALLSIAQYRTLYALIGTAYGGDGVVNFQLPNANGRTLLGQGVSTTGTSYVVGETGGQQQATLTLSSLPPHSHAVNVGGGGATLQAPIGSANVFLAAANGADPTSGDAVTVNIYAPAGGAVTSVGEMMPSGNNMPVPIVQPFLVNNYCIALFGLYPSRN